MLKAINYGLQTQPKLFAPPYVQRRNFWEYVNMMFNKPDNERIKQFGPDRACAEWVLRNGGKIIWTGGKILSDYNTLPQEGQNVPKVAGIDGTNSSISHYGFPHLVGCTMLYKMILHNSKYIDDRALKGLAYGKDTLTYVQISRCLDVTDEGIKSLKELKNLETLVLFGLPSVDNLAECLDSIMPHLKKCKIETGAANEINETQSHK